MLQIPVAREVRWICVAVLRLVCDPFCRRRDDGPGFHWKRRDSVGPTGTAQYSVRFLPKIPAPQGTGKHTHCRFRMATAVLRRPLLAALLPGGAGASGPSSRFRLRRRRSPPPSRAVSSDSPKPVASTSSSAGGDSPEEEPPVLPLLQELAVRRRASSSV